MRNPYQPLDQIGLIIDGLDIGAVVSTIREQGYAVVENFLPPQAIAEIRQAFNTEVPITEMRAIGTETGRTARAQLTGENPCRRRCFLDPRLRAVVEGIIGKYNQINVTTLFNTLPGETKQFFHQDDGLWPIPDLTHRSCAMH